MRIHRVHIPYRSGKVKVAPSLKKKMSSLKKKGLIVYSHNRIQIYEYKIDVRSFHCEETIQNYSKFLELSMFIAPGTIFFCFLYQKETKHFITPKGILHFQLFSSVSSWHNFLRCFCPQKYLQGRLEGVTIVLHDLWVG